MATIPILDAHARPLHDLRISVTDRCNFRCVYCMPRHKFGADYQFLPKQQLLSYEEIERTARLFAALGVRKLRITGGEPLIREALEKLIYNLARIPGIEDLSLTTNGALLTADRARTLVDAGLQRITISLDSIEDQSFAAMNGIGAAVSPILQAIEHADEAGLGPVKVNMVVKKNVNDTMLLPMAEYFRNSGHVLRFIEYMDVGNSNGWRLKEVVTASQIIEIINAHHPLKPIDPNYPGEVARRWQYADGSGEIGVIASVTQPFCGDCSRARLSAEGKLYTCLFASRGHDLRDRLRSSASDTEVRAYLTKLWSARSDRYSELRNSQAVTINKVEMSYIGG